MTDIEKMMRTHSCLVFGNHDYFIRGAGGFTPEDRDKFLYECKYCKEWLLTKKLTQDDLDFYKGKYLAEHKDLVSKPSDTHE